MLVLATHAHDLLTFCLSPGIENLLLVSVHPHAPHVCLHAAAASGNLVHRHGRKEFLGPPPLTTHAHDWVTLFTENLSVESSQTAAVGAGEEALVGETVLLFGFFSVLLFLLVFEMIVVVLVPIPPKNNRLGCLVMRNHMGVVRNKI